MLKKVIRDVNGTVINIGDWEYNYETDDEGVEVAKNPLPEGAVISEETVVETSDGGLAASSDFVTLRKSGYPTIVEQLDDIYHNGIDGWKSKIKAVKDKYPKG